jgi:hypothetical protein
MWPGALLHVMPVFCVDPIGLDALSRGQDPVELDFGGKVSRNHIVHQGVLRALKMARACFLCW